MWVAEHSTNSKFFGSCLKWRRWIVGIYWNYSEEIKCIHSRKIQQNLSWRCFLYPAWATWKRFEESLDRANGACYSHPRCNKWAWWCLQLHQVPFAKFGPLPDARTLKQLWTNKSDNTMDSFKVHRLDLKGSAVIARLPEDHLSENDWPWSKCLSCCLQCIHSDDRKHEFWQAHSSYRWPS
jgi:hypothetical protein